MAATNMVSLPQLRAWRLYRGLMQEELAEKAGVTPATISRIENGAPARLGTVAKLAAALGITREHLLRAQPGEEKRGAA
jgi:transcriptional regulator with XRE-family HTH domain